MTKIKFIHLTDDKKILEKEEDLHYKKIQSLINGYMEFLDLKYFPEKDYAISLIVNEENKFIESDTPTSLIVSNQTESVVDYFNGSALIVAVKGGEIISLTDEMLENIYTEIIFDTLNIPGINVNYVLKIY